VTIDRIGTVSRFIADCQRGSGTSRP
jgi:hypothetical protein